MALAVVAVAALVPVFIRIAAWPSYFGAVRFPLAFLASGLVLVAGLAVVKERRARRTERAERPVPTG
ncbi:hypothetical protein ABIA35_003995 [Catenulispora sp. MAP12-49]|uniref:hypothetical protein n=1 Tax=Catenulispora sp. MAP12-49 TaxID=3156302 RepID=UPI003517B12F